MALALAGCNNSPHPGDAAAQNTLFSAFAERSPKYLDPTASYSNNETPYTYQVYEPLYGYHYLKRPYELIPRAAAAVVQPRYLDKNGHPLPQDAPGDAIAESVYDVPIRKGIRFAPHPAFATDAQGRYLYHRVTPEQLGDKRTPWDFEQRGTRELTAEDFVYALKRHATPRIKAPVFGVFSEYVVGLKEYGELIRAEDKKLRAGQDPSSLDNPFLDFRKYPLEGVQAVDRYTVRFRIKGKYPQWKYWLAMTFMAPVPWEADAFYAQPGMAARGLSLNVWPVGTGPYMMSVYEQDRRHVLVRNPHYRHDPYPCEGMPGDKEKGLLDDCGKPMPFIDKLVFTMEKENVPVKAKFRQGYYDVPEVERPEYGIEFALEMRDSPAVEEEYKAKGFQLPRNVDLTNWYVGFNWLDPVVGKGDTPERQVRNRKLRQALSIAIDWEEYARVFPRKGGETAMSPLPAGMYGSRHGTLAGVNPVTHQVVDGQVVRRSLDEARRLLAEAGYPNGRDASSGQPLVLHYDYQRVPTPELKSELDWMVKQFAKLGVQLEIRATDYNQFQDKVRKGVQQIFWWGWLADYPDSENFLFLLYGPNSKAKFDGENTANYVDPEYDKRYAQLRFMDDGPEKQKVIDEMSAILQQDAPWTFGFFPYTSGAYQSWVHNAKPSMMIRDQLRYFRVDPETRVARQREWNRPIWWPVALLALGGVWLVWRTRASVRERDRVTARGEVLKEA
ncbi:ABC transporter substrate-binding protein [Aquabacterium sp. A7-Y]|uniref:ABC transporter substrate-binding protein n=1 Tax=Aquabacterium sp. A7-Y TaxID=1349605 RepID=UPI00223CCC51|nr:ABC transporter substrate-binding protein [Aquabacterium sp. A7-Y]MCW7541228.1 ABC transporter substrate-binding protein [Aquabacterium sp. A7-Y]